MTFTTAEFPIFFLLVAGMRLLFTSVRTQTLFLIAASCLFLASGGVTALWLVTVTWLVDFAVARHIDAATSPRARLAWLWVSIGSNLTILGCFKYLNFFAATLAQGAAALGYIWSLPRMDVPLPAGISYFTFTSIAYVIDVYYGRTPAIVHSREHLLQLVYFPKLLAGPITRAKQIVGQFRVPIRVTCEDLEVGLGYLLVGAVKKVVIADQVNDHVSLIFSRPESFDGATLLLGAVGYTVQIYCDFSGYSDMAVGCARVMGIRLPDNFAMPYSSSSISEFWRRWHMTLSSWFRDYVFLPMEMAAMHTRYPGLQSSINLTITMALCGLWHGPSWNFVLWGGLHGTALAGNRWWRQWRSRNLKELSRTSTLLGRLVAHVATLCIIVFGWVIFRSESTASAIAYMEGLLTWRSGGTKILSPFIVAAVFSVVATHALLQRDRNIIEELPHMRLATRVVAFTGLTTLLMTLAASGSAPFLYFQF